jgi:hypothetical protein
VLEKKGTSGKIVTSTDIIGKFNSFGYRPNVISDSIFVLLKLGLLDTDEQLTDIDWLTLPRDANISITSKGHYYYRNLIIRFTYLDLVLQDTPIFDDVHFQAINSGFPLSNEKGKRLLYDRIETARKFIKYLRHMEAKQPRQLVSTYGSLIDYIGEGLDADIQKMKDVLDPTVLKKNL